MRRINSYVGSTIVSAILIVLLTIVGLDALASIIDELGELERAYDFSEALLYVLFTLPGRVYEYIPFAALVGCLVGLGSLAGNSELVVMRAAGISVARLVWIVMRPALLFIVAGAVLSEYIAPVAEQVAQSRKALAQSGSDASFATKHGLWNREGNTFMHFNAVQPNGILYGVTLYRFDTERRLQSALFARRATFQTDHWLMEEVKETIFEADRTHRNVFNTLRWDTELSPDVLNVVVLEPDNLSISGLYRYAGYLKSQGLNASEYVLAFWNKCLQPFATASLVLIAISFIFGPLREVTMGYRVFVGVVIGIVFRTSQDLLGPASMVYGFAPIYAAVIPVMICAAFGVGLLRRAA